MKGNDIATYKLTKKYALAYCSIAISFQKSFSSVLVYLQLRILSWD